MTSKKIKNCDENTTKFLNYVDADFSFLRLICKTSLYCFENDILVPLHMSGKLFYIGFDADDTLWHCEDQFVEAQNKLYALLPEQKSNDLREATYRIEMSNIEPYGFGVKSFILSLVETYLKFRTNANSAEIEQLIDFGKSMLMGPVRLLEGVESTLKLLSNKYFLLLITKGDLVDQERKIRKSKLSKYFGAIEIVSEKNSEVYLEILHRNAIPKQKFAMIGNSMKSDILPVLNIGSRAIHIPYKYTWAHEEAIMNPISGNYVFLENISSLPKWLDQNI